MQLSNYGLVLEALETKHLETVRTWRNSTLVNEFMEFKEEISVEQQQKWFRSLDPKTSCYFIIKSATKPIGLIHLNNINLATKQAEVGLFIGESAFIGTGITFGASLLILDLAFDHFELETIIAKVNESNENAIRYNAFLGFKKKNQLSIDFSNWALNREDYQLQKPKLENWLQ